MIMTLKCKFTGEKYKIETNGNTVPVLQDGNLVYALDKGRLIYNGCPYWGDCQHSSNTMSCASFNDMPRLSFNL